MKGDNAGIVLHWFKTSLSRGFSFSLSAVIEHEMGGPGEGGGDDYQALEKIFLRNSRSRVTTCLNNDSNIYYIKAILCFIWNSGAFFFFSSSHNMTVITAIKMFPRR